MTRFVSGAVKRPISSPVALRTAQDSSPSQQSASWLFPVTQDQRFGSVYRVLLVAAVAPLLVALAAHISFPLPFTPVPFTLQPLAVMGVGLALGPWSGALAMLSYLAEGALGAPVFSPTGLGGLAQLLGPTGGFLLAYPVVALLCGGLTQLWSSRLSNFPRALLACATATILLFFVGAFWLHSEMHLTLQQTLVAAVFPFLPGELIKVFAAAGAYQALHRPLSGKNAR